MCWRAFCHALFRPPGPAAAGRVGLFCCCAFFLYFLPELIDDNRLIRRPPLLHQHWRPRLYSKNIHRHLTHVAPPPFSYRGAKCAKFWPKFRPQSSSKRRIFEPGHFIGKQKQTCQGPMIGLPPHQTWGGWVPPQLPEPLAHLVPQRVKVENFLYILHSSGPGRV